MSAVLSVVVMTSAFLLLFIQTGSWESAYAFNGEAYVLQPGSDLFTNGYRYLNWLIDVPMLLIQILFVAGIVGAARSNYMKKFSFSGCLMIVTGYIGQFYEPGRLNANLGIWIFFGLLSTAFFIHVLILIKKVINEGADSMEGTPKKIFSAILPLFYFSWWLYPIAYAAPVLLNTGVSYGVVIVSQQVIYTAADVLSKVVYGIMLTITAGLLSQQQGFKQD
jgi:bacteriorhodopsin